MTFSIRKALKSDAEAIAKVHVQSWKETYKNIVDDSYLNNLDVLKKTQMWEKIFENNEKKEANLVVENSHSEIVGFICGGAARTHKDKFEGEIYAIYILKDYQKKGLGSSLLKALTSELRNYGFKNMFVTVLKNNDAKIFYQKHGAKLFHSDKVEIGEQVLEEEMYGWEEDSLKI